MCSTDDGCWGYSRNIQRLNQTSPADRLAENNSPLLAKSRRLSHPSESIFLVKVVLCTVNWILNTVLFMLFLGSTVIVVPLCYCLRKLILYCSLRHQQAGKLTKMSASEAVWLAASCANTEQTSPVSNVFFIFEGKVTLDEIQNFVEDKLILQGKLRGNNLRFLKLKHFPVRVMIGYGWKEFDNLNISNYVFENKEKSYQIPADLKGITQAPDTNDLDKLWRVLVFPEFGGSEDTGVLIQVHESIADVFRSTRVVLETLDYKTIYLKKQCFLLGRLAQYFCACYTGPLVILKRLLMKSQGHFYFTRSEEASTSFDVSWSRALDLKSVKRIKDVTRTKGNIYFCNNVVFVIMF